MLLAVGLLFTLLPLLTLLTSAHWSMRVFDFVRLQTLAIQIIVTLVLIFQREWNMFKILVLIGLAGSMIFQTIHIYPYTFFYKKLKPKGTLNPNKLKLIVANVLQTNRKYTLFIKEIKRLDPDLFITMEIDLLWEKALLKDLKKYRHCTKVPLSNFYGMHLFSKIPLKVSKVKFLVEQDIPSIHSTIQFNRQDIRIIAIHPAPPSPTENETSKERDAELMLVAKMCRANNTSTIVCGDLNDVVWSKTSRLFTKITGFLDPRIGRGLYPTFHVKYWLFRFPLDHLFYSKDLHVPLLKRIKPFGSDHFGMYYEIATQLRPKDIPNPYVSPSDKKKVQNIIVEGLQN